MQQNILINSTKSLTCKLYRANYFDFMLHKGGAAGISENPDNMCVADFSDLDSIVSGTFYSSRVWSGATNEGIELDNIGLTGVDNGLLSFQKDRITNEEFLEIFLDSKMSIPSGDTRLFLIPVTGNTQLYEYPLYLEESGDTKFISFQGGFYQGFYKVEGEKYETLPDITENGLTFHFELRPRSDYNVGLRTVNYTHTDNKGMFFYIGTRAENKFWPFYKTNSGITEAFKKIDALSEGYFGGCGEESGSTYNINKNDVVFYENNWLKEYVPEKEMGYFDLAGDYFLGFGSLPEQKNPFKVSDDSPIITNRRFPSSDEALNVYDYAPEKYCGYCNSTTGDNCSDGMEYSGDCVCAHYFIDGYFDDECAEDNGTGIDVNYVGEGTEIVANGYEDTLGHALSATGYIDVVTDNKFLLFDRTPSGFTTDNWVEGTKVMFRRRQSYSNPNYFIMMDRTPSGYTVDTVDQCNAKYERNYSLFKDIYSNAFGARITDDGAIGYRYIIKDCEKTGGYDVIEEYSSAGAVKSDEWNKIDIKFNMLGGKTMQIMFYVNGSLVLASKDVDIFDLRGLSEVNEKQEGVAYNISLGGGTQGLMETILPNYYAISDYVLPIEKEFCGSFLGDCKCFRIYGEALSYSAIHRYLSKNGE